MKKILLLSLFFIISAPLWAQNNRAPAVDDIVGVEPNNFFPSDPNTQVLFDFDKKMNQFNKQQELKNSFPIIVPILGLLLLPLSMWYFLSKQFHEESKHKETEMENVVEFKTVLEERSSNQKNDDHKKAS